MQKCRATKKDGTPCTLPAQGSAGLCWAHSPEVAERRRKGQSRGGKSKPSGDLHMLKQKLITLGDDVLAGNAPRGDAAVAATCYGTAIKAVEALVKVRELEEARLVETQLRVREQEELVARIEELEEALRTEREGRGGYYGA